VLIVLSSLAIISGISYGAWKFWKRRRGFMGPLGNGT
jgi:hypothetical protein